jgi:hypothetical protein
MSAYKSEEDEDRKRLLAINLHHQICLTFEDVGAVLRAIERKLSTNTDFLETYSPGEAYISKVIAGKSDVEILETFGYGEELQELYKKYGIPREELWKGRKNFPGHIKSVAGIQDERKTICNKMKHGSVVLSRGGEILAGTGATDLICTLSFEKRAGVNVWHTDSFRYGEQEIQTWYQVIGDAPELLKNQAFQYVLRFHPDLREEWFRQMGL